MAALWKKVSGTPDAEGYVLMAEADGARFSSESEEYERLMDEYEEGLERAKADASAAEQRAQAEAAARRVEAEVAAEAARREKAAAPAKPKKVAPIEQRRLAHNAALAREKQQLLAPRRGFYLRHVEVLRPFVDAKQLAAATAQPGKATGGPLGGQLQLPVVTTPSWIEGEMRDYQLRGLSWMLEMQRNGVSAILGDEMGLGKTLQTISFLSSLTFGEGIGGPYLVVCPLSVLSSWMTEFRRWCPRFRVQKLHSADRNERDRIRQKVLPDVASYDVVVTTFEMVKETKFNNTLRRVAFRYLVIDEGHIIKNEQTDISGALRKLNFGQSLLLTGTPLQNNMHELWALLNFLYPDLFGASASFDNAFNLSRNTVDDGMLAKAHYLLRPFMLRRIKADVEKTVPPKEEIKVFCPLSPMQGFFYKNLLLNQTQLLVKGLETAADGGELEESGKTLYQKLNNLLMQLRKVCCHPFLIAGAEGDPNDTPHDEVREASGKLVILDQLLTKLQRAGLLRRGNFVILPPNYRLYGESL
jgi:hypothetical protein